MWFFHCQKQYGYSSSSWTLINPWSAFSAWKTKMPLGPSETTDLETSGNIRISSFFCYQTLICFLVQGVKLSINIDIYSRPCPGKVQWTPAQNGGLNGQGQPRSAIREAVKRSVKYLHPTWSYTHRIHGAAIFGIHIDGIHVTIYIPYIPAPWIRYGIG